MNKDDRQFMAEKIRTQYMEKQTTELEALRKLDGKVKRPANIFAYALGSVGAIVMGCGMSLVMTDIGSAIGISEPLVPGIVIGVIGLALAIIDYPVYRGILESRKKKYADEILKLSESIINQ